VTIKVNDVADSAVYFDKYFAQAPFKFDWWNTGSIFEQNGYSLLPGATVNITNWKDDEYLKLFKEARGTLDDAKRKEVMAQAQQILWDRGTQAIFAFYKSLDAHSTKFTGFKPSLTGSGLNGLHYEDVGLA
jgi:peptide/nickel transport system substrate-binding protein